MGLVCEKPVSIDVDRLLDLAKHDDLGIRAKALELLVNCGSDRLCQSFAAGDWRYDNETMERAEAILGSYLLIWHAPKLTIAALAERIVPELLAVAIKERGMRSNEIAFLHQKLTERLDEEIIRTRKSRKITAMGSLPGKVMMAVVEHDPSILTTLDQELATNQRLGFMWGLR